MTSAAMARRVRLPRRAVHSVTLLVLAFSTALLLQPAGAQSNSMTPPQPLTPQACPWATPPGVSWALIENYDNGNASRYGDLNTTLCDCVQACLDLPGCSGFDWYLLGHHTLCWLGTNCPVVQPVLEYDATNSHYVPLSMVHCYPTAMWAYESAGTLFKTSFGVLFVGLISALKFALKN
jgi:hypothetical protein